MRFSVLKKRIEDISQRMLAQTLRQLEKDGLVSRKVYPTIPPKVEYALTELGPINLEASGAADRMGQRQSSGRARGAGAVCGAGGAGGVLSQRIKPV